MNIIAIIILAAVLIDFFLNLAADILNLSMLGKKLPDEFEGFYDADRYAKSQQYLKVNTRFGWVAGSINLVIFLGFWFGGGFEVIDGWVRPISPSPVVTGLLYIGILIFFKAILSLPLSIYSTFVIEERFGFNKTTWAVFLTDLVKKAILSVLLGGVVLAGILAFFVYAGPLAWLYCWAALTLFMIVLQVIVPTWIMPLFNKFEPLPENELKRAILSYAQSIRFPLENVFVMDGSRRSTKSNAFFTGFGRHKRIVLFDTLIKNHAVSELVAVLAHEMGHFKKKHVYWMLAAGIVQSGVMLYLLSLVISSPLLFEAFYMKHPSVYAGLVFFGILYFPIDFFAGMVLQAVSRKNEYSADRFAVDTTGDAPAFINAMKKLAAHNLSNLTPHPFYVFLNYSHPPVLERIRAADKPERRML